MSDDKINEMLQELEKEPFCNSNDKFDSIFLIDDFTASGKSYFRLEDGKGKILKFLNSLFQIPNSNNSNNSNLHKLIDKDELSINMATLAVLLQQNGRATESAAFAQNAKSLSDEVIAAHPKNIVYYKNYIQPPKRRNAILDL